MGKKINIRSFNEVEKILKSVFKKDDVTNELNFLQKLSKHKLERLNKAVAATYKIKYKSRKRERLLGNDVKTMPEEIYLQLLNYLKIKKDERTYVAVVFEGLEGSRVGDVVELKLDNINFTTHKARVYNHKAEHWYSVTLTKEVEELLKNWISKNLSKIKENDNYIFFSTSQNKEQNKKHLSNDTIRNHIYRALKDLGLRDVYATSIDGRTLGKYSSHSLRGHAGTRAYELSHHDIRAVQKVLDHSPKSYETTLLYIGSQEDEYDKIMRGG